MDMMDDEDMRKSVIDKMMGELDDVTADSLKRKDSGPMKGVEIAITVTPKGEEEMPEEMDEEMPKGEEEEEDDDEDSPESSNYISQLLKKMG